VKCTARSTDTLTVVRAQDSTTARAYATNDRFELRPTAALFNEKANANEYLPLAGGNVTGNLGVGVTPTYKFQVGPNNSYNDNLAVFNEATIGGNGGVNIANYYDNTTNIAGIKLLAAGVTTGIIVAYTNNAGAGVVERMRIDQLGRVTAPFQPAFHMNGNSGTVTVAAGALIPFNNSLLNRGSHYNTSTYLFTAPVSGVYFFSASLYIQGSASICPQVNGNELNGTSPLIRVPPGDEYDQSGSLSFALQLSANDTVGIRSRTTQSSVVYTPHSGFTGYLIG
jgi:hypothetical protein